MKEEYNIICFLFGHKKSDFTDSGYHICPRCGSHEYYDFGTDTQAVLLWPYYWFIRKRDDYRFNKMLRKCERNDTLPF